MGSITTAHSILELPLPHCPHATAARTVCTRTISPASGCLLDNYRHHICTCNQPSAPPRRLRSQLRKKRKALRVASVDFSAKKKRWTIFPFLFPNYNFKYGSLWGFTKCCFHKDIEIYCHYLFESSHLAMNVLMFFFKSF